MPEDELNEYGSAVPGSQIRIPAGQQMTTIRSPNMPSIYINNAGLAISASEIRLFIGEQIPNADGTGVVVTQRLCLVMTPEVAKLVAENLMKGMEQFEQEFGKLRNIIQPKQEQLNK